MRAALGRGGRGALYVPPGISDTPGMARKAKTTPSRPETSVRPWWTSPLVPLVLLTAGVVLLSLDGMHPYRTYLRLKRWKRVEGQLVQPYQRRQIVNPSQENSTVREYLERRPQKRIFKETVSEGWPMKRKKLQWRIRLNYTYPWKNARYTRMNDGPDRAFVSEAEANSYLEGRVRGTRLKVWVDPNDPSEATAFLEYRRVWTLRVGFAGAGLGLFWLLVALVLGHSHRRREREAEEKAQEASPKKQ